MSILKIGEVLEQDGFKLASENTRGVHSGSRSALKVYPARPDGGAWTPLEGQHPRDPALVPPGFEQAVRKCCDTEGWPLFLTGEAGSGKTCAALSLSDQCGYTAYYTLCQLCDCLIAAQQGQVLEGYRSSDRVIWKRWSEVNLAILDEIGDFAPSEFTSKVLKKAIDSRQGKPLILISNRSLAEIEMFYGDPTASRIQGGTELETHGDRRITREHFRVVG